MVQRCSCQDEGVDEEAQPRSHPEEVTRTVQVVWDLNLLLHAKIVENEEVALDASTSVAQLTAEAREDTALV